MSNLRPRQRYEYEVISPEERIARDPRGLMRVSIIGGSIIVRKVVEQATNSSVEPHPKQEVSFGDPVGLAEELKALAHQAVIEPREIGEGE